MPGAAEFIHGPMLIGTAINIVLHGIMITQTYIYYTTYQRDGIPIKLFVLLLFLIDGVNTVFGIAYMYLCLIIHFGDSAYLDKTTYMAEICIGSTVVITLMVQLFYAWRIHVLTRNWLLVGIVTSVALTSAVSGFIVVWKTTVEVSEYSRMLEIKGEIYFISNAVQYLKYIQRKHKSGFKQTDMTVDRIIRITMQTCLATAVAAIIDLILFLSIPSGAYIALKLILSKLYSNALLSSLNSRGGWKVVTTVNPESGNTDFVCEFDPSSGWQDTTTSSQPSTIKPHASFGSTVVGKNPKAGVFVHIESHEMPVTARHVKDSDA